MTRKHTEPTAKTFKPMPPEPEVEPEAEPGPVVTIANLMTVSGISREQAEDMVTRGVVPDSELLQRHYGITAQAADAVIKIFQGE